MTSKVVRALGFAAMGGLAALGLNRLNYEQHQKNVVFPEQTNTINLLANSLPMRLSELLIQQNTDEINNIVNIDSNINVVVTDCRQVSGQCDDQRILFSSGDFQASKAAQTLSLKPFSVLRDPPPLYPEWELTSQNEMVQTSLSGQNKGQPIGRVYYFRDPLPSFWTELSQRFSISSVNDLLDSYILTLLLGLGVSMLMWCLFEDALRSRKRARVASGSVDLKIREVRAHFTDLLSEKESRLTTTQRQVMQIEKVRKELLDQNDQLKLDVQVFKSEAVKLKNKLQDLSSKILQEKSEKEQAQNNVKSFEREISSLKTYLSNAQALSDSLHAEVDELRSQKAKYLNQKSNSVQTSKSTELDALQQSQIELQEKLTNRENLLAQEKQTIQGLKSGIASLKSHLESAQSRVEEATQRVQEKEQLAIDLQNQYEVLRHENTQLTDFGDDLTRELDMVKVERDDLKIEVDEHLQTIRCLKTELSFKTGRIRQLESSEEPQSVQELDLSQYRIAILCGHDEDVRDVRSAMTQKYGECHIKTISQEDAENVTERRLRPKLASRDFVILLTRRASHAVSGNVKSICDALNIPVISVTQPGDGSSFLRLIEDQLSRYFGY